MKTVSFKVDGVTITAEEGTSVLTAALNAGIYIPHLCHHPDLPDIGACGLCLVESEGKIVSSCTLKVKEGLDVRTRGEKIEQRRELALKLILAAHPEDCSTCPKYGKCELQTLMQYMGVSPEGLNRRLKPIPLNEKNPLIVHDMTRCVLCGRCVRACHKVRGVGAIDYQKKNGESYIGTPAEALLMDADCRFCGACVEVCPTGALMDKKEPNNPEGYTAPCKHTCPAQTNVPEYIRLVKEGRYEEASCLIHERLTIPKCLGHVCSHPCETACRHECLNEAVSIRNLKLAAIERDPNKVWKKNRKQLPDTGKKVAVVGAGPCGLTAAYYLRKQGHAVTVFERQPEAGGMLRYGIPAYRMPRDVVAEEVADLQEVGFEIRYNQKITDYQALAAEYDAVVIAIGNQQGARLPIPGSDLPEVYVNLDFLRQTAENNPPKLGEHVLVLGGGNVAFDCARSAVRLGAQVEMACLESEEKLPGDKEELECGREEGIQVHFGKSFLEIVSENGHVTGVKTVDVASMYFDENRRLVLKTVPGSESVIPCDTVIFATGQRADLTPETGLQLGRGNSVIVDADGRSNLDKIYAAGDVTYGTQSVVKAMTAGRNVAESVDKALGGTGDISENLVGQLGKANPYIGRVEGFAAQHRVKNDILPAEQRKTGFMRAEKSFTCEQAHCEASRCLQCQLREQFHAPKTWNEFEQGGAQ